MLEKRNIYIFGNTKYLNIYSNFMEISNHFGLGEQYYIDISCGLYILGLKKGTSVNSILIEILKDFSKKEIIKESRYDSQIKSINYENISETFMKNMLFLLYNFIMSKADEQKIMSQIKMLENPEDLKDQSLSFKFENKKLFINISN